MVSETKGCGMALREATELAFFLGERGWTDVEVAPSRGGGVWFVIARDSRGVRRVFP